MMSDWISPKVEIKNSKIGGRGIFVKIPVIEGEKLIVWKGFYTDRKGASKAEDEGRLVMQWDEDLFSVEDRGEDQGYFINHSCNPNMWLADAHTLVARRNIQSGEELAADYVLWEADENYVSKWKCNCGTVFCRKKITGKDWKIKELQGRYKNHFSPLINKRILRQAGEMIKKATSCRGLVVQNGKVLLIRRHKGKVDYYVFPGGHTENDETPSEVASREILEETGLKVIETGDVIFYDQPKWGTHEAVVICQVSPGDPVLGGPETERNSPEDLYEPLWVDVKEALIFENLFPDPVRELFRSKFSHMGVRSL